MVDNKWKDIIDEEAKKDYFIKLMAFIDDEYKNSIVYPKRSDIFNAFKYVDFDGVKLVILGQDPYHGEGQSHGLAFSVNKGVKIPPSLRNMYKELNSDVGCFIPNNGYLAPWAEQGVLLLNTVLTVRDHEPNSHKNKGWEIFTDRIISILNGREKPVIFILWGNNAKAKIKLITNERHKILQGVHPSPLSESRGFFGCKHFSLANEELIKNGEEPINWQIPNV